MEKLILEIFVNQKWHELAEIVVHDTSKSTFSKSYYISNLDFFFNHQDFEDNRGSYTSCVQIPLDPTNKNFDHWPPFLLDLIPQGAARINTCKREKLVDSQANDFLILQKGAINPVGNLRVKSSHELFTSKHPGFKKQDIIEKNELFLEHAQKFGAIVVGTSGAQGVAPKLLINVDKKGHYHCDGALPDKEIEKCLIIKMPRGKTSEDRLILKNEANYLKIAKDMGLKSMDDFWWESDLLFLERFDRKCGQNFERYGLESLSSASGQYQFGMSQTHEKSLEIINKFSTNPNDLFEFVARDFLNIVMGNTDNHVRNTAFLKSSPYTIELSPIFDFAPMVMDSELIVRSCKWTHENRYIPDFNQLAATLQNYRSQAEVHSFFNDFIHRMETLPSLWKKYQIDEEVIKIATRLYEPFMHDFKKYMDQI